MIIRFAALGLVASSLLAAPARADWFGQIEVSSDQVERGVSQSDRSGALSVSAGWSHPAGAHASLGVATVSDKLYANSAGYKLMPELGWNAALGADWRAGVLLRGQVFPGARGSWYGRLSSSRDVEPSESDYGTAEAGFSLGWRVVTLGWSHSLTSYQGIGGTEASEDGQAPRRSARDSSGTRYLSLDVDWPVTAQLSVSAGAGRLSVAHFDELDYTDWRIGVTWDTGAWLWGLRASGTNADRAAYRPIGREDAQESTSRTMTASLAWAF